MYIHLCVDKCMVLQTCSSFKILDFNGELKVNLCSIMMYHLTSDVMDAFSSDSASEPDDELASLPDSSDSS